jgi:hypothetical protein
MTVGIARRALSRIRGRPAEEARPSSAALELPDLPAGLEGLPPGVQQGIRRDLATLLPDEREIVGGALPYTLTGVARLHALVDAVRYCTRRGIPGAFAECGVWRGGSVMAMILTLQQLGRSDRDIYLYDTFEGMTEPTEADTSRVHRPATELWDEAGGRPWPEFFGSDVFDEQTVRETLYTTGYPRERLHFVAGRVEDTLPEQAPEGLALLRLDTDWYESTRHELIHLYPRLAENGVLIIDDYGHWDGSRRAVDEYFSEHAPPVLLSRIDYSARMAVKH